MSLLGGVWAAETVGILDTNVCCEKTVSGLFCQNVPQNACAAGSRVVRTSCDSTSFCKGGYCYDSAEGTCDENVPQMVCNANNGTWSATKPAACNLGCCVIGDSASFTTLVRCKRLSSFYGVEPHYNSEVTDEVSCVLSARAEEKGACVFEKDFEKTCRFTTRSECTSDISSRDGNSLVGTTGSAAGPPTGLIRASATPPASPATQSPTPSSTSSTPSSSGTAVTGNAVGDNVSTTQMGTTFYPGRLCSDESLETNCGPTKDTICLPGKEEVYFKDTCGNPANIYDAAKVNDKTYWAKMVDKKDSCGVNGANILSGTCGNCNYLLGSYCRAVTPGTTKPKLGANICANLNCQFNGKSYKHGESWCGYDSPRNFEAAPGAGSIPGVLQGLLKTLPGAGAVSGKVTVGSKFFRYVCVNGDVTIEPCSDFRQEECLENTVQTTVGPFKQAACRVNRWQDCTAQRNAKDCSNTDKRDCTWLEGIDYVLMGAALNGSSADAASFQGVKQRLGKEIQQNGVPKGACVPMIPPGLRFWEGSDAKGTCAQANAMCDVTYEKGLIGSDWTPTKHAECLSPELEVKRAQVCSAMGDCGLQVNYIGQAGNSKGYAVKVNKVDSKSSSSSGSSSGSSGGGLLG